MLHGDFDKNDNLYLDPAAKAQEFIDQGAQWVHVVDLDGALQGQGVNSHALWMVFLKTGARIQLGGGIRTMAHIETWLSAGVACHIRHSRFEIT